MFFGGVLQGSLLKGFLFSLDSPGANYPFVSAGLLNEKKSSEGQIRSIQTFTLCKVGQEVMKERKQGLRD